MDTTSPITHVSLCAGYGGIDLGLSRAIPSLRTIAFSEIEAFACANLVSKMEAGLLDPAPIWTDLKTFPWSEFHGRVDILSGGYPCQPFSAAGKRLGAEDPRHLWPYISAGIAAMRPSVCFFENVEGHISLGLPDVLQDLAGMGYRTTWCVASASECGAPHQRKRIFILAYDQRQRVEELGWQIAGASQFNSAWNDGGDARCGELADTGSNQQLPRPRRDLVNDTIQSAQCSDGSWHSAARMANPQAGQQDANDQGAHGEACCQAWPSRPGEQQFAWEPPRVVVDAKSQRANRRLDVCDEEWRPRPTLQPESDDTGREDGPMGHAGSQRCEQAERDVRGEQQASGPAEECGLGVAEAMGNAAQLRRTRLCENNETIIAEQLVEPADSSGWQTQSSLGGSLNGPANRLGHAVLHVSTDNRTDELRLLGNGVVPATAERAFRVLVGELMEATT